MIFALATGCCTVIIYNLYNIKLISMQTSPLIIWQWFQSRCQLCYWSGRLSPQMDTTALQATTFRFLAQMDHNGGHKLMEWTTHSSCLECNWSHRRSMHIVLLRIFLLLKLVHLTTSALLSSKHQFWYFKACTTNHTNMVGAKVLSASTSRLEDRWYLSIDTI